MVRVARDAEDLIGDLPPELRSAFGETEEAQAKQVRQILKDGVEDIVARMMAGDVEESL